MSSQTGYFSPCSGFLRLLISSLSWWIVFEICVENVIITAILNNVIITAILNNVIITAILNNVIITAILNNCQTSQIAQIPCKVQLKIGSKCHKTYSKLFWHQQYFFPSCHVLSIFGAAMKSPLINICSQFVQSWMDSFKTI